MAGMKPTVRSIFEAPIPTPDAGYSSGHASLSSMRAGEFGRENERMTLSPLHNGKQVVGVAESYLDEKVASIRVGTAVCLK